MAVAVVQLRVGCVSDGPLQRSPPFVPRKQRHVGTRRDEVVPGARDGPRPDRRPPLPVPAADQRWNPRPHVEEPLCGELRVGVGHHAARHAELRGQVTGRRQAGLWLQPPDPGSHRRCRSPAGAGAGRHPAGSRSRNSRSALDSFIGHAAGSIGKSSRTVACAHVRPRRPRIPPRARHARVRPGRVRGADPGTSGRHVPGPLRPARRGRPRRAARDAEPRPRPRCRARIVRVAGALDRGRRSSRRRPARGGVLRRPVRAARGGRRQPRRRRRHRRRLHDRAARPRRAARTRRIRPPGTAWRRRRTVHRACAGGSLRRA